MNKYVCATKTVLIIDQALPAGLAANTAAILGVSLGSLIPEIVGDGPVGSDGHSHLGITKIPLPVLAADKSLLGELRESLKKFDDELIVIDVNSATGFTKSYEEYCSYFSETLPEEVEYRGIAISGRPKLVKQFTGHLPLLR